MFRIVRQALGSESRALRWMRICAVREFFVDENRGRCNHRVPVIPSWYGGDRLACVHVTGHRDAQLR